MSIDRYVPMLIAAPSLHLRWRLYACAQCDGDKAHVCDVALMPETPGLVDGRILDVIDRHARGGMCGAKALGIHCDSIPCFGDGGLNAMGMSTLADGARLLSTPLALSSVRIHYASVCRCMVLPRLVDVVEYM